MKTRRVVRTAYVVVSISNTSDGVKTAIYNVYATPEYAEQGKRAVILYTDANAFVIESQFIEWVKYE